MALNKNRIQYLLNEYLDRYGSIDILLPDGVGIEIGVTQETKHGPSKSGDYCWVVTKRNGDDRSTMFDRYVMTMQFDTDSKYLVDNADRGVVSVI